MASALESFLFKSKLEQDQENAAAERAAEQNEYQAKSALNALSVRRAKGDFAPSSEGLQAAGYLPSGARLQIIKAAEDAGVASEESNIRQRAFNYNEALSREKFNADTARRSALQRVANFNARDFAQLDDEAPEMEGLRSDFVLDPKTMQYTQRRRTGLNELDVRDQELSAYYDVPIEIVKERRAQYATAQKQAFDAAGDEEWQNYTRARQKEIDKRQDAEYALKQESLGAQRLIDQARLAAGMDEVQWRDVINNPDAYDDTTVGAARLAGLGFELKDQRAAFKRLADLRNSIMVRIQESAAQDPAFKGDAYSPENTDKFYTQSEALARNLWAKWETNRLEEDSAILESLGVNRALDEVLGSAPSIPAAGSIQWQEVPGPLPERSLGAALGAAPRGEKRDLGALLGGAPIRSSQPTYTGARGAPRGQSAPQQRGRGKTGTTPKVFIGEETKKTLANLLSNTAASGKKGLSDLFQAFSGGKGYDVRPVERKTRIPQSPPREQTIEELLEEARVNRNTQTTRSLAKYTMGDRRKDSPTWKLLNFLGLME